MIDDPKIVNDIITNVLKILESNKNVKVDYQSGPYFSSYVISIDNLILRFNLHSIRLIVGKEDAGNNSVTITDKVIIDKYYNQLYIECDKIYNGERYKRRDEILKKFHRDITEKVDNYINRY